MRISKETQARVYAYNKQVNYIPNMNAKRLRQTAGTSKPLVAVFWPIDSNPVLLGRFFLGLQQVEAFSNHQVEISALPYERGHLEAYATAFSRNFYSGAILMGLFDEDIRFLENADIGIPIVLFNRMVSNYSFVCIDNFDAGQMAAALFAARGHKNVAVIGPEVSSRAMKMRISGFLAGASEHQLHICDSWRVVAPLVYDGGAAAMHELLRNDAKGEVTAVFFMESIQCVGALHVLHEEGISVPGQMELLSFGDNPQDAYLSPALTSIRMPVEDMSRDCLRILLQSFGNPDRVFLKEVHPINFVFRESCGDFSSNWTAK